MTVKNTNLLVSAIGAFLLLFTVYSISGILLPFALGFFLAYVFNHPTQRMVDLGLSRSISSGIIVFSFVLFLILIVAFTFPYLQKQIRDLSLSLPYLVEYYISQITPFLDKTAKEWGTPEVVEIKKQISSNVGDLVNWILRIFVNLLTSGMAIANLLSLIFITPVITFYLLMDWPKITVTLFKLLPVNYVQPVSNYLKKIHHSLATYGKGQLMVCFYLVIAYSLGLWAVGLKNGFVVGLITGILSFIPYVGFIIGFITSLAISLLNFTTWGSLLLVFIVFIVNGILEGQILAPKLIGNKIGVHPVWIIFALLVAGTLFGFLGVLMALPCLAILSIVVRDLLSRYRKTEFFLGKTPARATKKDLLSEYSD